MGSTRVAAFGHETVLGCSGERPPASAGLSSKASSTCSGVGATRENLPTRTTPGRSEAISRSLIPVPTHPSLVRGNPLSLTNPFGGGCLLTSDVLGNVGERLQSLPESYGPAREKRGKGATDEEDRQ